MHSSRQVSDERPSQPRRRVLPITASDRRRSIEIQKLYSHRVRNVYSGCYVAGCRIKDCIVPTHRRLPGNATFEPSHLKGISVPSQNRTDMLHKLVPIPSFADPAVDDKEFKNLFHQYVAFDMPRITALMYPPSSVLSPKEDIKWRQHGIANLGMVAPIYFLLFVSMGHILELVRRKELQSDKISTKLYGRLMQVVRQKLENFIPSEASNLALAVIALSSFDMSLGNYAAVNSHRMGMRQLVDQVGIPNLGRSLPYVMSFDRLMAAFTGKASLYSKMPDRQFLRTPKHPIRYGLGFEMSKDKLLLDPDVKNLCVDICRAVEIAEAEDWTFRPDRLHRPYNASDVSYLYFMRDIIQNTCIVLQAKDLQTPERSKPIVYGAMIVQYIVLGKNELPWYTTAAADKLNHTLSKQDLHKVWRNSEDVLCWLMCLMIMVKPWRHRRSALKLFRKWLTTRASSPDGETCQVAGVGVCNPQDFLWSRYDFEERITDVLKDVDPGESSLYTMQVDGLSAADPKTTLVCWSVQKSGSEMSVNS